MKIRNTHKFLYPLLDQSIVSGVNFLTGVLVARSFSSEFYAFYYYGFLSIVIVNSLFKSSFIASPISVFPQKIISAKEKNKYFSSKVSHQIIISMVSSVILSLLFWYKGFTDPKCYFAIIGSIWFIQFQELYRSILFAKIAVVDVFWNDCFSYGTRLLLFIFAIWFDSADLYILFTILGLSSLIGLTIGYYQTRIPSLLSIDRHQLSRDFHFGKWLFLEAFLSVCSYGGYMLLMSRFVDDFRFGTLAACDTLVKVLNILFIGLFNIATPLAARKFNENHDIFLRFIKNIRISGTALVFITCFSIYALKDTIFHIVYADKFTNYSMVLLFLMLANLAFFHQFVYVMIAKIYERTQIIFFARIISTIFSLSAGVFLAIQYSVEGIAITIALSGFFSVLFFAIRLNTIVSKEKSRRLAHSVIFSE